MTDLAAAVRDWAPAPEETTDLLAEAPARALAGLFDQPAPDRELPPLWHWLYFLDRPAESELGPDGHPLAGTFLPPIPRRRRMWAGGRVRVHAPLRLGTTLRRRAELAAVTPKSGRTGDLLFTTVRYTLHDADSDSDAAPLLTEEQDIVYRSGDQPPAAPPTAVQPTAVQPTAVQPSARSAPQPGDERDEPWRIALDTDPVLLFRFSALTYNSHRIHYDPAYATEVEGHQGLVVHGPLLAVLMAELPRRHGHPYTALDYRLRTPLSCGQRATALGAPTGALRVVSPTGATTATMRISR